ncbi:MAG: electron transfer flavoprotein subunit beta/FixA family protein [Bacillota bacterium]|jgi:electron transfer flavoprotein beta subunit|nr:electron transfer flavoprotein subunit beta/FixA family protein [Bacillota bacterium]
MHYVVCIKQVPEGTEVAIDEEKGVLKREGVESKLNIYDAHALEAAVELKERYGGTVTVLSMGPPQAESIIREAYALGADQGYLLSDRAFAGADTLATSYTLSEAIRRLPQADLILCGMQTTDGDTAQVGPGIAELLELPHVSYVSRINRISNGAVEVEADMGDGIELLKVGLPCLLTVTKAVNQPRLPSFRLKKARQQREVNIWTSQDLPEANPACFGLSGSPTQVERIFAPTKAGEKQLWQGTPQELSQRLVEKLKELKYL